MDKNDPCFESSGTTLQNIYPRTGLVAQLNVQPLSLQTNILDFCSCTVSYCQHTFFFFFFACVVILTVWVSICDRLPGFCSCYRLITCLVYTANWPQGSMILPQPQGNITYMSWWYFHLCHKWATNTDVISIYTDDNTECIIVHMYRTEPGRDTRTRQLSIHTIDGFHSIFSLGNWRTLHHHAPCWLVNIHITWPFCPLVSMVKDAMKSVYILCKGSPVFTSWWSTRSAGPKIALHCPRLFVSLLVCLSIRTHHMHNNYITYIIAMRL